MPFGTVRAQLKKNQLYFPKTVPKEFCMNEGHINFFLPKLTYVLRRLQIVRQECERRGFASNLPQVLTDLSDIPEKFFNDWECTFKDSVLIRIRLCERLHSPLKAKDGYHKFWRNPITDMNTFCETIKKSRISI